MSNNRTDSKKSKLLLIIMTVLVCALVVLGLYVVKRIIVDTTSKDVTIYFVRHGQTDANTANIFAGCRTDAQLTEEGINQALRTGGAVEDIAFDKAYSSELVRAQDTAKNILAKNKNNRPSIETLKLLNDIDWGMVEGMTQEEVFKLYPDFNEDKYIGTRSDVGFVSPIEAETKARLVADFSDALKQIVLESPNNSNVLVVGHSSMVWLLQSLFPNEVSVDERLDNASVTIIRFSDGEWQLAGFNLNASEL